MNYSVNWKPSASNINLLKRATIISKIRRFFNDRGLIEVDTPILSRTTVTDIHLTSFRTSFIEPGTTNNIPLYLITSPEYHMKRLLASGMGPIFQICHSFRNEEIGRYHNPEFTILEWYRPYYDMHCLMKEVNDFLRRMLNCKNAEMLSYQEAFIHYVGLDPLCANKDQLYKLASKWEFNKSSFKKKSSDNLLQLLFTMLVEPNIGHNQPTFIYHFPTSQAALASINVEDNRVADRFEVYFKGIELANGFRELTDAFEQHRRFEQDNYNRLKMNLDINPIDENLLAALKQGIPECSGVALGVDRLIMLALKAERLSDVIAFSVDRA